MAKGVDRSFKDLQVVPEACIVDLCIGQTTRLFEVVIGQQCNAQQTAVGLIG